MSKDDKKSLSFEKALSELEEIVNKMEETQLSLEDMMKYFEKGKKLSELCGKKLSEYEKKIEILVKKKNNSEENQWDKFKSDELF